MRINVVWRFAVMTVVFLNFSSQSNAQTNSETEVLSSPDICTVGVKELSRRLDAVRTPEKRAASRKEEQTWTCYAPRPGHPTEQEKRAYIQEVSRYAKEAAADLKGAVPAAVIAAMALEEAGYGFTRTAINAKNLFGWKKTTSDGREGQYVLSCQDTKGELGDKDDNRCYVKFESRLESVQYVSGRLAAGFRREYAHANARYKVETAAGKSTIERTQNWIMGIADPYNWKPTPYAQKICRLMREPVRGSDRIDPEWNLYRLTAFEGEKLDLSKLSKQHQSCASLVAHPEK